MALFHGEAAASVEPFARGHIRDSQLEHDLVDLPGDRFDRPDLTRRIGGLGGYDVGSRRRQARRRHRGTALGRSRGRSVGCGTSRGVIGTVTSGDGQGHRHDPTARIGWVRRCLAADPDEDVCDMVATPVGGTRRLII